MLTLFKLLAVLFTFVCWMSSVTPAFARPITTEQVEENFVRYLSVGRGNTEIHINTMIGGDGLARILDNRNGTHACYVSGLGMPDGGNEQEGRLMQRGKLIHEYTHCLASPYFDPDPTEMPKDLVEIVSRDLTILTRESIADARALIEISRRDGLSVAQEYARIMFQERVQAEDMGHRTTRALKDALRIAEQHPKEIATDEAAFATALEIGKRGARETIEAHLKKIGRSDVFRTPFLLEAMRKIDSSVKDSLRAFLNGQYRNNALTVHTSHDEYASGDYHVFVDENGTMSRESTIGTEGVRGIGTLKSLIASSDAPAHRLAVEALGKHGQLGEKNLLIARRHFEGFVRLFGKDSEEKRTRVLKVIEDVVTENQKSDGLESIFDGVLQRLLQELEL